MPFCMTAKRHRFLPISFIIRYLESHCTVTTNFIMYSFDTFGSFPLAFMGLSAILMLYGCALLQIEGRSLLYEDVFMGHNMPCSE